MFRNKQTDLGWPDIFFSVILSFALTAATDYIETGSFTPSVGYFAAVLVFLVCLLLLTVLLRKILQRGCRAESSPRGIFRIFSKLMENRFHVIIIAVLICICWIPALLFLYPGTFINDTWGELIQFILYTSGEGGLSDHHPLFDTFLMGSMIVPLAKKTGEWHFVIFCYVLIQAALTSLAFSCTIHYALYRLKLGIKAVTVLFLIYCLLPIYPASVQTVSKDALFAWIYVFFAIQFMEIVRSEGASLKAPRFLILFSLNCVFCCLTKKIGIYVIAASLLTLFLFQRKNRLLLLIPLACSFLVINIILPQVITALDAIPGGKQEKYSLPFQMTARYFRDYPEDITEEEYEIIGKVLLVDEIAEKYDPTWADPVKYHHQRGADEDYPAYLKVWFRMGLRHPDAYLAAFNSMMAGWFSWTEYAPLMNMDHRNQLDSRYIPKWVPIRYLTGKTSESYQMMFDKLYENPFTRLFFTYGFYASILPAFAAATVMRKREDGKRLWLAVVPLFFSLILGCWMAPASVHLEGKRYLYPITYTLPLCLTWCMYLYSGHSRQVPE